MIRSDSKYASCPVATKARVWGIIDSRSVKTLHYVDSDRGFDGNKKVKGSEQHIIVDTEANLISVVVHEANVHDRKGAPEVIENLSCKFPRLAKILADVGYRGSLSDWVLDKFGWKLEVVFRSDESSSKFKVILKRWIVARSFTWQKNSECSLLAMSIMPTLPRQWFNLISVKSYLTNLFHNS